MIMRAGLREGPQADLVHRRYRSIRVGLGPAGARPHKDNGNAIFDKRHEMQRNKASRVSLIQDLESLLEILKGELKRHYGKKLISAIVFGSVGRGEPRSDSDIDILIVAKPLPNGRTLRLKEFAAVRQELSGKIQSLAKRGIFTSLAPVFKTPEEVCAGSLLFLDMITDGRVLYDRSSFWRNYLRDFQGRLHRLGAKRIVVGDRWYWDLKPDYVAGEVFEI
jgi:uncharacterized protein